MPDEQIIDNLEDAKNDKLYFELINMKLSNCSLNRKYTTAFNKSTLIIEVKVNDSFNYQYNNKLLELKTRLDEEHKKLLNADKKETITQINFIFNNKTITYNLEEMTFENN